MTKKLEPLPSDIAELIARGAAPVEPPAHVRQRLRERLTSGIVGSGAISTPPLSPWTRLQNLAAAMGGSRAFVGLAGFLAGAATILVLRSTPAALPPAPAAPPLATQSTAIPAAETLAPSPEPRQIAPSRAPEPTVLAAAPVIHRRSLTRAPIGVAGLEKPIPPPPAKAAPMLPERHWGLMAEGELLQKGRTAMVRGDSEGALAVVEEHLTRFPQGKLAEEREALKIQALVLEDRNPEARAALATFRETYSKSLLGPALEEAVMGKIQ